MQRPIPGMSSKITVVLLRPLGDTQSGLIQHSVCTPGQAANPEDLEFKPLVRPFLWKAGQEAQTLLPKGPLGDLQPHKCLTGLVPPVRQQKLISRTSCARGSGYRQTGFPDVGTSNPSMHGTAIREEIMLAAPLGSLQGMDPSPPVNTESTIRQLSDGSRLPVPGSPKLAHILSPPQGCFLVEKRREGLSLWGRGGGWSRGPFLSSGSDSVLSVSVALLSRERAWANDRVGEREKQEG